MCDISEAKNHIKLGRLYREEKNLLKSKEHLLEAASIYILQAQLQSDDDLIEHANECYAEAHEIDVTSYTKEELARRTLHELDELSHGHSHGQAHLNEVVKS